ncbi:MAG: hypothetical protein F4Y78_07710 [Candidatus Dadabacteria bacterium]|nr:hypothetical protein [Candidatus Dadabacteria bacterium]MYA48691.1 hypothetical protein [Candidatus Dadabacteria bacterium]
MEKEQIDNAQSTLAKFIEELGSLRKLPQLVYFSSIFPQDWEKLRNVVSEYKKKNPQIQEIDFVLHSPGGTPEDAYRIIRTLRNNFDKVNIVVPFWAKSAATLLSLGASEIIMDDSAEFGPLDVQLPKQKEDSPKYERESALTDEASLKLLEDKSRSLFKTMFKELYEDDEIPIQRKDLSEQLLSYASKLYEPLLKQINPYKLGEKKRKLDVSTKYAHRILLQYNKEAVTEKMRYDVVDFLVNSCPEHGYVVDYDIVSIFLPIIRKSIEISGEYQVKLSQVTSFCMSEAGEIEFIGFMYEEAEKTKKIIKMSKKDRAKASK